MADDSELEKCAIEELLRETSRARVRAETMGPAGWLKCPLRGTNKRFLLNTLRSSGLQRHSVGQPAAGQSTPGGRQRGELRSRDRRGRSRTPPRDHRANGGHRDHKHHHRDSSNHSDKRYDREKDKSNGHKDKVHREQRHWKDGHNTDPETHTLHSREPSPGEGHCSSRSHSLSRECCRSHHRGDTSSSSSPSSGHAPQRSRHRHRPSSRSPGRDTPSRRSQK